MTKKKQIDNARARKNLKQAKLAEMIARKKRNNTIMMVSCLAILFVLLALAFAPSLFASTPSRNPSPSTPSPSNPSQPSNPTEIAISLSQIGTSAKYYTYDTGGKSVRYFVVKGTDGAYHSAFDACDVCYLQKKGFHQEGSDMVCNNCGKRYSTNLIGTENVVGGCWPGFLASNVDGNAIKISTSALTSGQRYF